jgi:hypothetical protein
MRPRAFEHAENVRDRLGFVDDLSGKADAKGALDPQNQLGATETVNAEIAPEPAARLHIDEFCALGMKLANQPGDDGKQIIPPRARVRRQLKPDFGSPLPQCTINANRDKMLDSDQVSGEPRQIN